MTSWCFPQALSWPCKDFLVALMRHLGAISFLVYEMPGFPQRVWHGGATLVLQPRLGRREGRQEVPSQALHPSFSFPVLGSKE